MPVLRKVQAERIMDQGVRPMADGGPAFAAAMA